MIEPYDEGKVNKEVSHPKLYFELDSIFIPSPYARQISRNNENNFVQVTAFIS
jgi:hypothetical protein